MVTDLEVCATFVYANRLVADILKDKAEKLFNVLHASENVELRIRLIDIARTSILLALRHERLANLQERGMGAKCHCTGVSSASQRIM